MIVEKTFYAVKCDNCGAIHNDEGDFPAFWDSKEVSWEMAGESNWQKFDGKHYCDECYSYDDDDVFQINLSRQKQFSQKQPIQNDRPMRPDIPEHLKNIKYFI